MKTNHLLQEKRGAYALLIVMCFVGLGVMLLVGIMNWTSENSRLTDRNNEYYATAAAAEAATERVLVHLSRDYIANGEGAVLNNLASYSTLLPSASDDPYWGKYSFKNPADGTTGTYVSRITPFQFAVLDGQYQGLNGYQSTYRISSDAQLTGSRYGNLIAGVRQDVAVESIPIFQFAIFYDMDLEINPSPPMVVNGRVHANGDIYTLPSSSLTFNSDVTASGNLYKTFKPGDPLGNRGIGAPNVIFKGKHDGGTSTLNLPIGTNNTPDNVFEVLKMAPAGEDPRSPMGTNRFYNKADLVLIVSNNTVTATSGVSLDSRSTVIPTNQWMAFLRTNVVIYNKREGSSVQTVQFDVAKYRAWAQASTNPLASKLIGKTTPNIVYIADMRSPFQTIVSGKTVTTSPVEAGVYVMNGAQLPVSGLTVATPNPIYVQGDYNVTSDGTHYSRSVNSTMYTLPAALMGDAITVMSTAWSDANSSASLSSRTAADTTVNAAFLAGIVPTGNGYYSGGVENFPRFLENWSGKNFWYNGSMVAMFDSRTATAPWGSNSDTYNPPNRNWAFDTNFSDITKLPPGTPQILFIERMAWAFQPPGVP